MQSLLVVLKAKEQERAAAVQARKQTEKELRVQTLELQRLKDKQEHQRLNVEVKTHAAVTIQRFLRRKKQEVIERKAQRVRLTQDFKRLQQANQYQSEFNVRSGIVMIKNHFNTVNFTFAAICKEFLSL